MEKTRNIVEAVREQRRSRTDTLVVGNFAGLARSEQEDERNGILRVRVWETDEPSRVGMDGGDAGDGEKMLPRDLGEILVDPAKWVKCLLRWLARS